MKKQQKTRTVNIESVKIEPAHPVKASDDNETDIQVPLKTAVPLKSTKWVTMRRGAAMDSIDQ